MILRVVPIVIGLVLAACAGENFRVLASCRSPDSSLVATFYRRFGGGAAGWQRVGVQIHGPSEAPNANGAPFEISHWRQVRIHWTSTGGLEIVYPRGVEIWAQDSVAGSVRVTYVARPSDDPSLASNVPVCVVAPLSNKG